MTSPATNPATPGTVTNNNSTYSKPPMTDNEIRLECLKQAVILGGAPSNVITLARQMFTMVVEG